MRAIFVSIRRSWPHTVAKMLTLMVMLMLIAIMHVVDDVDAHGNDGSVGCSEREHTHGEKEV